MSETGADSVSVAIQEMMEQFAPLLRATCRRFHIFDDEVEELRQDVRIRLWRVLVRDGTSAPGPAYCRRLVTSAAADIARRRRWARVWSAYGVDAAAVVPAEFLLHDAAPDRLIESRELERRIDRCVATLAPPRNVVVRLYLEGFDRLEIAQRLQWSEPKVRNLLYRGLHDLRLILAGRGFGPFIQVREKDSTMDASL
jgi:RNA polymerase sigma-70 factor (ECF subfamily)